MLLISSFTADLEHAMPLNFEAEQDEVK